MAAWILVPCLVTLREEFNTLAPKRDKGADGSIGDQAHANRPSDHNPDETGATTREDADRKNEVHALDIDSTGKWPSGMTFDAAINLIVDRHKGGKDDRLLFVIWNRRIAEESKGWKWRPYSGTSDPHTGHAHFSAKYTTAQEANTRPWGLLERFGDLPMDQKTFNALMDGWAKSTNGKAALERAALADCVPIYDNDGVALSGTANDVMQMNNALGYVGRDHKLIRADLKKIIAAQAIADKPE